MDRTRAGAGDVPGDGEPRVRVRVVDTEADDVQSAANVLAFLNAPVDPDLSTGDHMYAAFQKGLVLSGMCPCCYKRFKEGGRIMACIAEYKKAVGL